MYDTNYTSNVSSLKTFLVLEWLWQKDQERGENWEYHFPKDTAYKRQMWESPKAELDPVLIQLAGTMLSMLPEDSESRALTKAQGSV